MRLWLWARIAESAGGPKFWSASNTTLSRSVYPNDLLTIFEWEKVPALIPMWGGLRASDEPIKARTLKTTYLHSGGKRH
jgi:hypothetical protein